MSDENVIDEIAGEEEAVDQIPLELDTEEKSLGDEDASDNAGMQDGGAEDGDASEEKEPVQKMVSLAALHEERGRRQELQDEVRQTRDKMAKMEALFERMQQPEKPEAEAEIPRYEDDPDGYYQAKLATLEAKLDKFEGKTAEQEEAAEVNNREQQLVEQYAASVRTFTQTHEDFDDAYKFLSEAMDKDLEARGYTDPAERNEILRREEGMMAGRAMRLEQDPAEIIYNYAKSRGYQGGENKLEKLEKGQKAAASLSRTGGGAPKVTTLESLLEMEPGPEFDKAFDRLAKQGRLG